MKMKIHKYKTLKGLIRNTRQFSLNTLLSGQYYHNKTGWGKLKVSEQLEQEVYTLFNSFLNININRFASDCGLFNRLKIEKDFKVRYIAGQDYSSEIRYLKRLLK
jgi:hypothetical protein